MSSQIINEQLKECQSPLGDQGAGSCLFDITSTPCDGCLAKHPQWPLRKDLLSSSQISTPLWTSWPAELPDVDLLREQPISNDQWLQGHHLGNSALWLGALTGQGLANPHHTARCWQGHRMGQ